MWTPHCSLFRSPTYQQKIKSNLKLLDYILCLSQPSNVNQNDPRGSRRNQGQILRPYIHHSFIFPAMFWIFWSLSSEILLKARKVPPMQILWRLTLLKQESFKNFSITQPKQTPPCFGSLLGHFTKPSWPPVLIFLKGRRFQMLPWVAKRRPPLETA